MWVKNILMKNMIKSIMMRFAMLHAERHPKVQSISACKALWFPSFCWPGGSWGHLRHAKVVPCLLLYVRQTWPKVFPRITMWAYFSSSEWKCFWWWFLAEAGWASITQLCVSESLFVLVPAQSSGVNGTTKTKLFLQGTSELHNEAVTVARMGPA